MLMSYAEGQIDTGPVTTTDAPPSAETVDQDLLGTRFGHSSPHTAYWFWPRWPLDSWLSLSHLRIAWCTMAWSYLSANASQPWYPPRIFTAIDGQHTVDVLTPDAYWTANYATPDK